MATIRVVAGKSITAALEFAQPGDIVEIPGGVYKERLLVKTAGVTLRGAAGETAVLDGGYSHESACLSGDSWDTLVYRPPTAVEGKPVISVQADGVTLDGLTIQNSGDSGIAAGGVRDLTIRNCRTFHTYGTAIKVLDSDSVLIEHCRCNVASVMIFNPGRGGVAQGVSGVIKTDSRNVVIQDCEISNGYGEGLNVGKGGKNVTVRRVKGYNCNHKIFYVNRSQDVAFEECIAFNTGDPAHLWTDKEAPAGFACNDETTRYPGKWPDSKRVTWRNCMTVNCGIPWQATADNAADGGFVFENNILVWGPLTRKGIWVGGPQQGICRGNTFYVTPGAEAVTGNPAGMKFENNRWSVEPPPAWRGGGDSYGDVVAPSEMPTAEHDSRGMGEWYEFKPELYGDVVPPPPPPPPPPDEPDPVDVAAILAELQEARGRITDASLSVWNAREAVEAAGARVDELIGGLS